MSLSATESTTSIASTFNVLVNATAQSPRSDFCNVLPPYLPPDCHMDSMCDKLHPSLPLVLQVVCWKLFHSSACCTVLVLTLLTWENIRSTHAEECGNATSVHISSDRTSNFGLALQSVICFSSSQNAGGSISARCSRSPLYAGSSLHWSQRRSRWSSETTVGNCNASGIIDGLLSLRALQLVLGAASGLKHYLTTTETETKFVSR